MMFDANLTVLQVNVIPPEVDEKTGKADPESTVQLALVVGFAIPGPQGVATMPGGILRVSLPGELAMEKGTALVEAGETIPEPPAKSDLIIPGSMDAVENVAKQVQATEKMRAKS